MVFEGKKGVPVVLLIEWDNPRDEERNKKRLKHEWEVSDPHWIKMVKEKDIKVDSSIWAENTGHMYMWMKFETMEDFAKMWNDERHQQIWAQWAKLRENVKNHLLRPEITIPENVI